MAKTKDLIVNAPKQGIAQSPHVGFDDIRNLDIDSEPGIVKLNNSLIKNSATTVVGQINWIVRDPLNTNKCYAVDNAGQVYAGTLATGTWSWATLAGETAGGHGNGLAIWKDYLFVARDAYLDVYGPLSSSPSWSNSWQAIDSDVLWHPMIVSKNDSKLYGGAGQYVFSLDEDTTFAPGTGASYTWTSQALDLPSRYRIKCLEELGNNLMMGTWQGTTITDIRVGDIFTWDRSSVSFGQPIIFSDYGIHAMKNIGNSLVVLAGTSGTIYRCDGVNTYIIGKIPIDLSGGKYLEYYPGAITYYKNKTYFGIGNGGTTATDGMGVYSLLQTGRGNLLNFEHIISSGNTGSANSLKVSALLPITLDTLFVGWRDNTTYGIDISSATAYPTDYSGYFDSPLYIIGTNLNKRALTELEFQLSKELATGEGIRVAFRVNLTDDFTTIGTFTHDVIGAVISYHTKTNIPATEMIQLRVSLLGTSTTTPRLKNITLR